MVPHQKVEKVAHFKYAWHETHGGHLLLVEPDARQGQASLPHVEARFPTASERAAQGCWVVSWMALLGTSAVPAIAANPVATALFPCARRSSKGGSGVTGARPRPRPPWRWRPVAHVQLHQAHALRLLHQLWLLFSDRAPHAPQSPRKRPPLGFPGRPRIDSECAQCTKQSTAPRRREQLAFGRISDCLP